YETKLKFFVSSSKSDSSQCGSASILCGEFDSSHVLPSLLDSEGRLSASGDFGSFDKSNLINTSTPAASSHLLSTMFASAASTGSFNTFVVTGLTDSPALKQSASRKSANNPLLVSR